MAGLNLKYVLILQSHQIGFNKTKPAVLELVLTYFYGLNQACFSVGGGLVLFSSLERDACFTILWLFLLMAVLS